VRMYGPGTHSSGPRPKLHWGSPWTMSLPTFEGDAQLKCAVPCVELPDGWQRTPSCWAFELPAAVFPLLKMTATSPFGSTTGSEPWSKLHAFAGCVGSKKFPNEQSASDVPLISSGVDQVTPWSVDIEP